MLALTNACNLSCEHCYRDQSAALPDELSPSEVFGLIGQLAELCHREGRMGAVVFSGGEPMLCPYLGLAIRVVRSLDMHARLNTNATLATPTVARALASWGLQVAQVSLDGPSPEVHEKVRGDRTWELTRKGVANLQEAGVEVEFKVTLISGVNDADPAAFTHVAERWGVRTVSFARLIPIGSGKQYPAFDGMSWRAALERLAADRSAAVRCEIRDATFDRSYLVGLPHRDGAEEGHHILAVDADGTALVSRRMPLSVGNIRRTALTDLWHHPELEALRRWQPSGKCKDCGLRATCRGGSRAAAWAQGGSAGEPDPACWVGD